MTKSQHYLHTYIRKDTYAPVIIKGICGSGGTDSPILDPNTRSGSAVSIMIQPIY
jgi:hypothetical protein